MYVYIYMWRVQKSRKDSLDWFADLDDEFVPVRNYKLFALQLSWPDTH